MRQWFQSAVYTGNQEADLEIPDNWIITNPEGQNDVHFKGFSFLKLLRQLLLDDYNGIYEVEFVDPKFSLENENFAIKSNNKS